MERDYDLIKLLRKDRRQNPYDMIGHAKDRLADLGRTIALDE